jgi:hypothetical protein
MELVVRRRVYRVVFDCPDDTRPMNIGGINHLRGGDGVADRDQQQ